VVETYRQFAKFNYDCGDYQSCRDMLDIYLSLNALQPAAGEAEEKEEPEDDRYNNKQKDEKKNVGNSKMYYLPKCTSPLLEILWGKLSCEILLENWEDAGVALDAVKTGLEELASSGELKPLEALIQRTWLLHWGLFVFWNNNSSNSQHGLDQMVELFTTEKYLQAITTNAPHLLRYLTAAVLLIKRRKSAAAATGKAAGVAAKDSARLMKDLVKIMQHCDYSDPIVEFVECLCVKFDFESAQTKLMECESVLETDFFLCRQTALFMEEARVFVFENYCRIHHKIDLSVLGEKLAMEPAQAERWIVDLIRNALLDAKIDSSQGCVVMGVDRSTVYEQVMDRTRDLNLRSSTMAQNLQTILNDIRKEKQRRAKVAMEEEY
jgi:translation initiation factor 3 subunit E